METGLDNIDWTATYRRDSTVVAPYGKWSPYHDHMTTSDEDEVNLAEKKTKKVAWFVSNCGARNGRLQYAQELAKYIRDGNPIISLCKIIQFK